MVDDYVTQGNKVLTQGPQRNIVGAHHVCTIHGAGATRLGKLSNLLECHHETGFLEWKNVQVINRGYENPYHHI